MGPLRLVGSGLVPARQVKLAAFAFLGLGGALGAALAATTTWWLLLVGAAAIAAAWTYTGGSSPYGYKALGEVSVFVFFGLVAVVGTAYVQIEEITGPALAAGVGVGALACAILVANNLRDIPTDTASGKRTLAVLLGDANTRRFFTRAGRHRRARARVGLDLHLVGAARPGHDAVDRPRAADGLVGRAGPGAHPGAP